MSAAGIACCAIPSDDSSSGCDKKLGGSAETRRVFTTNFLVIYGVVQATYYWCYLLPAFEHDPTLGWTRHDSTFAASYGVISEMVGMLILGPLADHFPVARILVANSAAACLFLVLQVSSQSCQMLTMLMITSCFVKSLMWPAISAHTGARLHESVHDSASFISALASRCAEVGSGLILGFMIERLDLSWRAASLSLLGFVMLVLGIAFSLYPPSSGSASRRESGTKRELLDILYSLCFDLNAWLILISTMGANLYWPFQTYTPLLLQELHEFSAGDAASATAVLPAGMTVGLFVGSVFTFILSPGTVRVLNTFQASLSVIGLAFLAIYSMPVPWTLFFLGMVGFGAVVPLYVPSLNFAASGLPDERGLRLSVIWALSGLSQFVATVAFGKMREDGDISIVAPRIFTMVAQGLLASVILMAGYYWRISSSERTPLLSESWTGAEKKSYAEA